MYFGRSPFTCSGEEGWGGGSLNDFKSGTSVGRFSSDGAASRAVKGLNNLVPNFSFLETDTL